MELELIKASALEDYARDAITRFGSDIPITLPRARSQAMNPDASREDILLIVAVEDRKLLSFIGIYPSLVRNDPGKRIFWISCWWKAKGVDSGISRKVLEKFIEVTDGQVGVPHLPPHIIKILERNNVKVTGREGLIIRTRPALHERSFRKSLKGRYRSLVKLARLSGFLKAIDLLAGLFIPKKAYDQSIPFDPGFYIIQDLPGEEFFEFIQKNFPNHLSIPTRKSVSWIINFPWLVTMKDADKDVIERYYFSYVVNDLHYFFPVLKIREDIVGTAFFNFRDGAVKSLFIFVLKEFETIFFRDITNSILNDKKVHSLITYHPQYTRFLKESRINGVKIRNIERYTGIGNEEYHGLKTTDADGDSCFT